MHTGVDCLPLSSTLNCFQPQLFCVTSLTVLRKTSCAGKHEGYFDFEQTRIHLRISPFALHL
jgi:hypothetical protein